MKMKITVRQHPTHVRIPSSKRQKLQTLVDMLEDMRKGSIWQLLVEL